ncbi:MAG: hypothetical protein OEM18_06360 [Nitrosopumilus sp.]|nr:hypothetical protein [Nitrosopumilus sp.]MDH3501145.1 hypothetical protein [Nitrosopumilus sp.]
MNRNKISIPIGIGIVVIIIAVIFGTYEKSENIEVEDVFDKELRPEEVNPEIQKKLDEIEEINLENDYSPKPREWITSGPFQIDRSKYALGEKVFLRIGGLGFDEKGQVAFMRPLNDTHYSVYLTIPFDGAKKDAFNYYIDPQLSKARGLCSVDDVLGKWAVVFRGTDYSNLYFEIIDEFVPGTESSFEPVC